MNDFDIFVCNIFDAVAHGPYLLYQKEEAASQPLLPTLWNETNCTKYQFETMINDIYTKKINMSEEVKNKKSDGYKMLTKSLAVLSFFPLNSLPQEDALRKYYIKNFISREYTLEKINNYLNELWGKLVVCNNGEYEKILNQ